MTLLIESLLVNSLVGLVLTNQGVVIYIYESNISCLFMTQTFECHFYNTLGEKEIDRILKIMTRIDFFVLSDVCYVRINN